jgi:Sulfotransferase domain
MTGDLRRHLNSSEYLRELKNALLRRTPAGHFLTVYPDDAFLVSYPRSGRTWSRFLIANLRDPANPATFADIAERVPGNHTHSDRALLDFPRPRIIASHKAFYPYYPSVVYVVRDPRDVAISRYYYELKMGRFDDGYPMEDFVRSFVTGGIDEYRKAGGWGDHVLSWLAMRAGEPNFFLLRYEDLKQDAIGQLARLARFLKLEAGPERLARAVELSSPERMRELDEKEPLGWLRGTRRDVPFVRKGVAGGWRSQLSESAISIIESAWGPLMRLLHYRLVGLPSESGDGAQVNAATCAALSSLSCFEQAPQAEVTA